MDGSKLDAMIKIRMTERVDSEQGSFAVTQLPANLQRVSGVNSGEYRGLTRRNKLESSPVELSLKIEEWKFCLPQSNHRQKMKRVQITPSCSS
jgi:hypothetical protein